MYARQLFEISEKQKDEMLNGLLIVSLIFCALNFISKPKQTVVSYPEATFYSNPTIQLLPDSPFNTIPEEPPIENQNSNLIFSDYDAENQSPEFITSQQQENIYNTLDKRDVNRSQTVTSTVKPKVTL